MFFRELAIKDPMNCSMPGLLVLLCMLSCLPVTAGASCRSEYSKCMETAQQRCPNTKANADAVRQCHVACQKDFDICLPPQVRAAERVQQVERENPRGRCPAGYWISEGAGQNSGFTCARISTTDPSVGDAFVCPPGLVKQSDHPSMFDCLAQKK